MATIVATVNKAPVGVAIVKQNLTVVVIPTKVTAARK